MSLKYEKLIRKMTLAEKAVMMSGKNTWETVDFEKYGKMTNRKAGGRKKDFKKNVKHNPSIREFRELQKTMKTDELIHFIKNNPSVLKRPIILNESNFQVGYDEEEIGVFVPKELRNLADHVCNPDCPNYKTCGEVHKEA